MYLICSSGNDQFKKSIVLLLLVLFSLQIDNISVLGTIMDGAAIGELGLRVELVLKQSAAGGLFGVDNRATVSHFLSQEG